MAQPAPIEQFGKYQILERIARGGMAEIFKARMEGIGGFNRLFAIKRIVPGLSQNREYIDLLVDEAKIAGLLSHANIVQILDLGQVNGQYYVAMEYVEGRDLGSVLRRCRERGITLPVPHAVFILIETLKGLEYAHNRQIMRGNRPMPLNIVHRDVSPSNVLVSFQGEVKLTDFGIAKANVKAMETLSGVIKGKFDYMSPEQASGNAIDQRTDLFAAGVLLYEMLCGQHPFRQAHEMKTVAAIRAGEYKPPSFVNPDVPYGLEVVLDQALAREPEQRFQTATAFKDALTKFFHDAGFIFSHSTLAAFLKGLFPEANLRRRQKKPEGKVLNLRDQETRPLPEDEDDLDAERPTTLDEDASPPAPSRPPPPSVARPPIPPVPSRPAPPEVAGPQGGSQSTIVRRRAPPRRTRAAPPAPLIEAHAIGEPTHTNPGGGFSAHGAPPQRLPKPPPPSGVFEAREPRRTPTEGGLEGDTLLREIPPEKVRTPRPRGHIPAPQRSIIPDESTLIRQPDDALKQALSQAEERAAQARIDEWADEKPTVVRGGMYDPTPEPPRPAPPRAAPRTEPVSVELELDDDELSLDEHTQSHSATLELDEPSIAAAPAPLPLPRAPAPRPEVTAERPAAPAKRGHGTAVLVASAFVGATLGVLVGVVVGAFVGWQLHGEVEAPPPEPAPVVEAAAPTIAVLAAEDARVFLDGRLKQVSEGEVVELHAEADEAFMLRVVLDDEVIYERESTLPGGGRLEVYLMLPERIK